MPFSRPSAIRLTTTKGFSPVDSRGAVQQDSASRGSNSEFRILPLMHRRSRQESWRLSRFPVRRLIDARHVMALLLSAMLVDACGSNVPVILRDDLPSLTATLSPPDLAAAVEFRRSVGFEANEALVRRLADDPQTSGADNEFGVPLTAEEAAELEARAQNSREVAPIIEAYGEGHLDTWGGLYIDHDAGGVVAALFTRDVQQHRLAVGRLVHPDARFEVRRVGSSLVALEMLRERIDRSTRWLGSLGARWRGTGIHVSTNQVRLEVSAQEEKVAQRIIEHLGARGVLSVEVDTRVVWNGPFGSLFVRAVSPTGDPIPGLRCRPTPDEPPAYDSGDTGVETTTKGVCYLRRVGATGYRVDLLRPRGNGWIVVGTGRTVVPPGGEGVVTIVVARP